jgi:hypothetical protein
MDDGRMILKGEVDVEKVWVWYECWVTVLSPFLVSLFA